MTEVNPTSPGNQYVPPQGQRCTQCRWYQSMDTENTVGRCHIEPPNGGLWATVAPTDWCSRWVKYP